MTQTKVDWFEEEEEIPEDQEITIKNVQFYCKHSKMLKNSQKSKALKFVNYDCIRYIGDDPEFNQKYTFICLPLNTDEEYPLEGVTFIKKPFPADYNRSDYKIAKNKDGIFECNCQGWQSKARKGEYNPDGCMCSHVLALMLCFKMKKFGKKSTAVK